MSYCGRERPQPNSNNMIWHDFYVIVWAHPEIPNSIPTLGLNFLFSSQTALMWLFYLFANFNDTGLYDECIFVRLNKPEIKLEKILRLPSQKSFET